MYLWHGRALIVGPGIDSSPHAHHAAQLTLALERPVRVRRDATQPWQETRAALFAPNDAHQLDCGGAPMAHLFIDMPLRPAALPSELRASFADDPVFEPVRMALDKAAHTGLDESAAARLVREWLECALPGAPAGFGYDPRIGQALQWIARHPGERTDGRALAAMVHLSESRFTHLFRQQTGLSLSRYLIWARLLHAVELAADGASMTEAAHGAGFADLAHLSRSFRGTFGVMPSALRKMTIVFKRADNAATTLAP
ncbi:MAG TPA: AraC family transcriptional regulator [Noviherbaspirillum sp.]|nr:AraC family transcriptional regulator [Noviherbaspirillum sp.]